MNNTQNNTRTCILSDHAGLHEDFFVCLDVFRDIVHNITERSTLLEAWLTFLSTTDINAVTDLTDFFPQFLSLYQEITDFIKDPEELMNMLSEELSIMDRNTERLMVEELQEEVNALTTKYDALSTNYETLTTNYDTLATKYNSMQKELAEKDALIAQLQATQK